ncbi:MAG: hypothetical protein KF802_15845 [Bdellovibrionaceae bacterium]|nr:hypothetical protein [Pseudobdellovibrionaceae bacterium]
MSGERRERFLTTLKAAEMPPDTRRLLEEISAGHLDDLTRHLGLRFAAGDLDALSDRAALEFRERLPSAAPSTDEAREAWTGVVRDFLSNRHWGFTPEKGAAPKRPKKELSPQAKELIPYLWVFVQAAIIMKLVVYYFGLKAADDPTVENKLVLLAVVAFSFGSLIHFAWRMHRKEQRPRHQRGDQSHDDEGGEQPR